MGRSDVAAVVEGSKGVIFDLFHTLTALEWTCPEGPATHEILGIPAEVWNDHAWTKSRDRITGLIRDPFEIVRRVAHGIDSSIPDGTIRCAAENRIRRFEWALVNIPDETRHVLRELKAGGKKLGLISDADVMEAAGWARCPVRSLFDTAVFSCEVGCAKPEREIYQMCLRRLGVAARDCVYVGDGGSDELAGARRVGMTSVMITGVIQELWPEKIPERRPHADFVIERLTELVGQSR